MSSSTPASSSSRPPDLFVKTDTTFEPLVRDPTKFAQVTASDHLIIDNGSHSIRAGFSSHLSPYIIEPNLSSKYRSKSGQTQLNFGHSTELSASSRANQKPTWEGDLLLSPDGIEAALDYSFSQLRPFSSLLDGGSSGSGSTSGGIGHPVIMTERLGTPLHSRTLTSELLFEAYSAPSVVYGIDGLFGFHHRLCSGSSPGQTKWPDLKQMEREGGKDGLVINMGHWSTTIIPVLAGKGVMDRAKRIPWGGAQASELVLKLAQLKYPNFPTRVTPAQATYMYHETAYFASDYQAEIESLSNPVKMAQQGKIVQFDFVGPAEVVEKTEEELAAAQEKKSLMIDRLREQTAKKKAENAAQRDRLLILFRDLRANKEKMTEDEFEMALLSEGFESYSDLDKAIKNIESAIKRSNKANGEGVEEEEEIQTFPLVDTPDDQLDEEGKKEKRRQKLLKSNYDARMRMKAEKKAEKERLAEEKRKDEESRAADPEAWAARLRKDHNDTILRMKERKKKRQALTNRKTAAAQARMKTISNLANDQPPPKRRKKANDEDDFGADDDDWAVYREIDGGEDSEAEADDQEHIRTLEAALLEHDPEFDEDMTLAAQNQRQNALINAFVRSDQKFDLDDVAQAHQIHLNVERIRVPETWFHPAMAGVDSAGIAEVAGWLLNGFAPEERRRMMQGIYVTGGSSVLPNLTDRLHRELTALLPFQEPLKIVTDWPGESTTSAWKGMASWSRTAEAKAAAVTRAEWHEMGSGYLKEHRWGNWADEVAT